MGHAADTYQVLTNRPARMASLLGSMDWWDGVAAELGQLVSGRSRCDELVAAAHEQARGRRVLPELGASVESQKWAEVRIHRLIETPATIRFLSCEPLLEAVDLTRWLLVPAQSLLIHWVIAGGESGPGARPMHPRVGTGPRGRLPPRRRGVLLQAARGLVAGLPGARSGS